MKKLQEMPSEWFNSVFQNVSYQDFNNLFLTSSKFLSKRHTFWDAQLNNKIKTSKPISFKNPSLIYQELNRLENDLYFYNLLYEFPITIRRMYLKNTYSHDNFIQTVLASDHFFMSNQWDDPRARETSYLDDKKLLIDNYNDTSQKRRFNTRFYTLLSTLFSNDFYIKPAHTALYPFLRGWWHTEEKKMIIDFLVLRRKCIRNPDLKSALNNCLMDSFIARYNNMASQYPENYFDEFATVDSDEVFQLQLHEKFNEVVLAMRVIERLIRLNCTQLFELLLQLKPYLLDITFGKNASLLQLVIKTGTTDIFNILLSTGIDLNKSLCIFEYDGKKYKQPALYFAIEILTDKIRDNHQLLLIIQQMLQNNVDLDVKNDCIVDFGDRDGNDGLAVYSVTLIELCEHILSTYFDLKKNNVGKYELEVVESMAKQDLFFLNPLIEIASNNKNEVSTTLS